MKSPMFFNTAAAQIVSGALDRCAREQILTVIVAAPGRGKTEAVKHWSKANVATVRHIRIVCTIRNSPHAMLEAIARGLGVESARRSRMDRSCIALAERLSEDPVMLILDEADMLSLPCLEKLRGIWDEVSDLRGMNGERAFPLALAGTDRLRRVLLGENLERLHRRVGEFEELPGLSAAETAAIIEKKWPHVQVDEAAIGEICAMSRGSFGWLDRIMAVAGDLAAKDGKVVNHRVLRASRRYLIGVGGDE